MFRLIITEEPEWLKVEITDIHIMSPSDYIGSNDICNQKGVKVINLCNSYKPQNMGYYVSLLAEARGHKVIPETSAIADFNSPTILKDDAKDFDNKIQQELSKISGNEFELLVYFGFTMNTDLGKIGILLFNLFQVPVFKATFSKKAKWQLSALNPVDLKELSEEEKQDMAFALRYFLSGKKVVRKPYESKKYDLAIMVNPDDPTPPSDSKALQNFIKAAEMVGFNSEIITKNDFGKLTQFDALFIRETTAVGHHTLQFARKAEYEGLAVIDDPASIMKCSNKVYLKELLATNNIPIPESYIIKKEDISTLSKLLDFPFILKKPNGYNPKKTIKIDDKDQLIKCLNNLFETTDILIAEEFIPTAFDWWVGILNGEPLYVYKNHTAHNHWQIIDWKTENVHHSGISENFALNQTPDKVIDLAIETSLLIGKGLYGIDIKETEGNFYIVDINGNLNINSDAEDKVTGAKSYHKIMDHLMNLVVNK